MIDWRNETLLSLSEAAKRLGKSRASIYRWMSQGVRGVRLEVLRGGRLFTSEEAIQRFFETLSQDVAPINDTMPSPCQQARADRRAQEALRAAGWL